MKIGLRVFYNFGWMGGVQYVLNLAGMLRALPDGERPHVTFLTAAPAAEAIAAENRELVDAVRPFAEAAELGLDFVYPATQASEAPFDTPWGGWVPDWQCLHYPDLFADDERTRRRLQYRTLIRHAPVTVFSSRMALEDSASVAAPERAGVLRFPAVLPDAVYDRSPAELAETRARLGVPDRYFLICNQFWKHKNHLVVLEALRRTRSDAVVVMTGEINDDRWPDYRSAVEGALADPALAGRAVVTGRLPREDQLDLLRGAEALVQPSLFEGWNTAVEEARALGLPTLLSEFPVHREQAPEGSAFFDPHDPEALAGLLDAWWTAPRARPSPEDARRRHGAYVADRAREFLAIAAGARDVWDAARHEPKAFLAREIVAVREEVGAGSAPLGRGDYDRYLATVRSMFRTEPDQLRRFADQVCAVDHPLYPESEQLLLKATLAKMPPDLRARFFAAEAADGPSAGRPATASRSARTGLEVSNLLFRARDFARRRFGI